MASIGAIAKRETGRDTMERARARGCRMAQLNSNKARANAHRFYEAAGFAASHEGFKAILGTDRGDKT